jgi:hypothetical protein
MTTSCANCSSPLSEGSTVCPNCGTAVAVYPGVAEAAPTTVPIFKTIQDRSDLNGIGGWLILPAIGLVLTPIVNLGVIFGIDIPALNTGRYQNLISLEIIMNLVIGAAAVCLCILFFKKKAILPRCMVYYLVGNFILNLLDYFLAQGENLSPDPSDLGRSIIAAAIWIPYFLSSRRVKATFVN